jgi:hypothetical protein
LRAAQSYTQCIVGQEDEEEEEEEEEVPFGTNVLVSLTVLLCAFSSSFSRRKMQLT